jgi:hypothetical protein
MPALGICTLLKSSGVYAMTNIDDLGGCRKGLTKFETGKINDCDYAMTTNNER